MLATDLYYLPMNDFLQLQFGDYRDPDDPLNPYPVYKPSKSNFRDFKLTKLPNEPDQFVPTYINLGNKGPLTPGLSYLNAGLLADLLSDRQFSDRHMMIVATTNLTIKASLNKVLVWATNIQTSKPVSNVPLKVLCTGRDRVGFGLHRRERLI